MAAKLSKDKQYQKKLKKEGRLDAYLDKRRAKDRRRLERVYKEGGERLDKRRKQVREAVARYYTTKKGKAYRKRYHKQRAKELAAYMAQPHIRAKSVEYHRRVRAEHKQLAEAKLPCARSAKGKWCWACEERSLKRSHKKRKTMSHKRYGISVPEVTLLTDSGFTFRVLFCGFEDGKAKMPTTGGALYECDNFKTGKCLSLHGVRATLVPSALKRVRKWAKEAGLA